MPKYGLLIAYDYCIGCRVCETACSQEHNRPAGEQGIQVIEIAPEIAGGKLYYLPFPTDHCNLCGKRLSKDLPPACVQNCLANVMRFGMVKELIQHMEKHSKYVLWVLH